MTEIMGRCDTVADDLLEFRDLWKSPLPAPRPHKIVIDSDLENTAGVVRDQGDGSGLFGEG